MKNYWLWILVAGVVLFVALYFVPKDWETRAPKLQGVIVALVLMLFVILPVVNFFWGEKPPPLPQQVQQLSKPMLTMPPNGDSARISPNAGQIVIFTGNGFEHHLIYADGQDCVVGNTENPCKDGPILYQYVRDTTGKPNSVTYKFVR